PVTGIKCRKGGAKHGQTSRLLNLCSTDRSKLSKRSPIASLLAVFPVRLERRRCSWRLASHSYEVLDHAGAGFGDLIQRGYQSSFGLYHAARFRNCLTSRRSYCP